MSTNKQRVLAFLKSRGSVGCKCAEVTHYFPNLFRNSLGSASVLSSLRRDGLATFDENTKTWRAA